MVGEGGWGKGARVKAVREMPRPCVEDVAQAQGILPMSKSSITKSLPKEGLFRYKQENSYYTRSKPIGEERYSLINELIAVRCLGDKF